MQLTLNWALYLARNLFMHERGLVGGGEPGYKARTSCMSYPLYPIMMIHCLRSVQETAASY